MAQEAGEILEKHLVDLTDEPIFIAKCTILLRLVEKCMKNLQ